MEYTPIILGLMGGLGVLAHNLNKLDSINRSNDGKVDFRKYLILERFSILVSIVVIIAAVIASHEIKQLQIAGKWLALGFLCLGYAAQSILVKLMTVVKKRTNKLK